MQYRSKSQCPAGTSDVWSFGICQATLVFLPHIASRKNRTR